MTKAQIQKVYESERTETILTETNAAVGRDYNEAKKFVMSVLSATDAA